MGGGDSSAAETIKAIVQSDDESGARDPARIVRGSRRGSVSAQVPASNQLLQYERMRKRGNSSENREGA